MWTGLATWRGPTANTGGMMSEVRGLVLHIAEGYYQGTIGYQYNAAEQVSSHFVVSDGARGQGHDGDAAQLVDTDRVAWTQKAGNGHWLSVECAGFTPHPLTAAQVEKVAQLLAAGHRVYGYPLQLATSPRGYGLGHHSMGSHPGHRDDWGHSQCPGPAIIAQKPVILDRAFAIINGGAIDDMTPDQAKQLNAVYQAIFYGGPSCGTIVLPKNGRDPGNSMVNKLDELLAIPPAGGAGPSEARIRAIVREELDATRLAGPA